MSSSVEWPLYKVSAFAEVVGGGTPDTKDPDNFGSDIPWITPKDLSMHRSRYISHGDRSLSTKGLKNSSAKRLPAGAVLVSSRAPIGLTAIANNEVCTNQGCRSLVLKPEIADSEFVYYLITSSTDYLHQHANGTTFMELPGGVFKNLEFRLPPLHEQRRIAAVLAALDERIESCRSLISCLESAMALETAVVLDAQLWPTRPLPDVATIGSGYSYKSSELVDHSTVAMVNLKNFGRRGGLRTEGLKPFVGTPKGTQFLRPGDAMISKTDLTQDAEVVGRCLRMPKLPGFEKFVASLDVAIVRSVGELPQSVLTSILAQPAFRDHCLGYVNGTTVLHLAKAALETYQVPSIDPETALDLAVRLDVMAEHQDRLLAQLHELEAAKSFMLPRLISGELRVSDNATGPVS